MDLQRGAQGTEVEYLQRLLIDAGYSLGRWGADGDFGEATERAVIQFQHVALLEPNGIVSYVVWLALEAAAEQVRLDLPAPVFEPWDGPAERQPRNRNELYSMLGDPAVWQGSKATLLEHIVYCHPEGNRDPLPGHEHFEKEYWVAVHKTVEPYLREAMRRASEVAPGHIRRVGCYNYRRIKNPNQANPPLSVHSWGAAVDINPQWNRAITFPRGKTPKAWSDEWKECWPHGLPREVVEAFKSCGFAWGSDWDEDGDVTDHTWGDPMHFEWVARDGIAHLV